MSDFSVNMIVTMDVTAKDFESARMACRSILGENRDALDDMQITDFHNGVNEEYMTYLQRLEMHLAAAVAVLDMVAIEQAKDNVNQETLAFTECESPALRTVYETLKLQLYPFPTKEQCEGVTLYKFRNDTGSGDYAEHYNYTDARNEWVKSLMSPDKFYMSMFKEIEFEAGSR